MRREHRGERAVPNALRAVPVPPKAQSAELPGRVAPADVRRECPGPHALAVPRLAHAYGKVGQPDERISPHLAVRDVLAQHDPVHEGRRAEGDVVLPSAAAKLSTAAYDAAIQSRLALVIARASDC